MAQKGYARLVVADSEEYGKLQSVSLISRAELVKFLFRNMMAQT